MGMLNFFNLNHESKAMVRDYCYLSLANNQPAANKPSAATSDRLSLSHQMQQQQRTDQKNALLKQQHKRRSRSQSRNPRVLSVQKDSQLRTLVASEQPDVESQPQQNLFEAFLVNNNLSFLKLIKFDEKVHLNAANIQMYLEKLCIHKKHLKLENLKSLNLSNNKIVTFKICLNLNSAYSKANLKTGKPSKGSGTDSDSDIDENPMSPQTDDGKAILKVFYPNLTHLDLSSNQIRSLNQNFGHLENLSYLNVSSNPLLCRISPKLCLLTKLWNFDLKNCSNLNDKTLNEMVNKQRVKTSEILAYLKSIHENSKPYMKVKLVTLGVQGWPFFFNRKTFQAP